MTRPCGRRGPLAREGASQADRLPRELEPAFFPVDERTTPDLIRFAERYARHLTYYTHDEASPNTEAGDWTPFFARNPSAALAGLATLPVPAFRAFFEYLARFLTTDPGRAEEELASHLRLLFLLPPGLVREAGGLLERLPEDHPFRAWALHLVRRELATPFRRLLGHYRGAVEDPGAPLLDDQLLDLEAFRTGSIDEVTGVPDDGPIRVPSPVAALLGGLGPLATPPPGSTDPTEPPLASSLLEAMDAQGWDELYSSATPDAAPFQGANPYERIRSALGDNLLVGSFARIFQGLERLASKAEGTLEEGLEGTAGHAPHYGLWLTFLQLLRVQRSHLNELTAAHMEHYFRGVLRLKTKGPVADRVHLLVELARNHDSHLLSAGTRLRAGKDDEGREAEYRIDRDVVVNRARVEELRSVRVMKLPAPDGERTVPSSAPVTNSRDGQGKELPEEHPGWSPFGPDGDAAPLARIGFALADRRLFLREGVRTISVSVRGKLPEGEGGRLTGWLTGADGWFEAEVRYDPADDGEDARFRVSLDGAAPAVVPFDPDVHDGNFGVGVPVLRVELPFDPAGGVDQELAEAMLGARIETVQLEAAAEGLRNLTVQGELGTLDPSKPFLPFGPTPERGAPLVLGSSEVFSKPLRDLTVHVRWSEEGTPDPGKRDVRVGRLVRGRWESATTSRFPFLGVEELSVPQADRLEAPIVQTPENVPFGSTSVGGFLRLELADGLGHREHLNAKTLTLIQIAAAAPGTPPAQEGPQPGSRALRALGFGGAVKAEFPLILERFPGLALPEEPYVPKILDMSLSYRTTTGEPEAYFHLHPFGHTREPAGPGRLVPELPHEGALYVGVAELQPRQRLSLLFQVVEGSGNPLKLRRTLEWHYLKGNAWKGLDGGALGDTTADLARSGIVTLAVPADADTEHTVLPAGQHWFRIAASRDADAVNDLLTIDAQAVSATFFDRGNDPAFTATPLPAGTISRLRESRGAIKSVSQPYPSFGGHGPETPSSFRTRVSERLRHKGRAAAAWDYERLVLEAFPRIHRVKCIGHAEPLDEPESAQGLDNEVRPGHVLVVPVPYVVKGGAVDPLRPYTDSGTLAAIDAFLRKRTSPFVRLHVRNPRIEEVQVSFDVGFRLGTHDLAFHESELNAGLVRFLTPWFWDGDREIRFGGRWHKSQIVNFIEEQPYVDFVKDFQMYHKVDLDQPDEEWQPVDLDVVEGTTARSILVSHRRHEVRAIPREEA